MVLSTRQRRTGVKLYRQKGGAVWWRVGEGKTRIAYKFFAMIAKSLKLGNPRFLVVCRREAFVDWTEELALLGLRGKGWRTVEVEEEEHLYSVPSNKKIIYLISHGKLTRLLPFLLEISSTLLHAVAYDEGWLYKNPRTAHAKAANKLSTEIEQATILSGSMMTARDLTDVYGQLFAINKHECLARTLTEFNSRFMFRFQIRPDSPDSTAAAWRAQRGAGVRVARSIKRCSSVYFPNKHNRRNIRITRRLPATKAQREAFKELKEFYELSIKDHPRLIIKVAPTIAIKCQQISDGWVKLGDGQIVGLPSRKMAYLMEQVADLIACGERIVIWTAFQYSAKLVLQQLQKTFRTLGSYMMHGGKKFDVKGWRKDGRVAVATVGSGSSINHFKNCAYAIYYSHDTSWRHMQQSQGRTDRKDSKHKTCYYYFLQTKGSMDARIYSLVNSSCNEEKALITEAQRWLTT